MGDKTHSEQGRPKPPHMQALLSARNHSQVLQKALGLSQRHMDRSQPHSLVLPPILIDLTLSDSDSDSDSDTVIQNHTLNSHTLESQDQEDSQVSATNPHGIQNKQRMIAAVVIAISCLVLCLPLACEDILVRIENNPGKELASYEVRTLSISEMLCIILASKSGFLLGVVTGVLVSLSSRFQ